jgi:hypothetical protein
MDNLVCGGKRRGQKKSTRLASQTKKYASTHERVTGKLKESKSNSKKLPLITFADIVSPD